MSQSQSSILIKQQIQQNLLSGRPVWLFDTNSAFLLERAYGLLRDVGVNRSEIAHVTFSQVGREGDRWIPSGEHRRSLVWICQIQEPISDDDLKNIEKTLQKFKKWFFLRTWRLVILSSHSQSKRVLESLIKQPPLLVRSAIDELSKRVFDSSSFSRLLSSHQRSVDPELADERIHWAISLASCLTEKRILRLTESAAIHLEKYQGQWDDEALVSCLVEAVGKSRQGVLRLEDFFGGSEPKTPPDTDDVTV